MAVFKCKMCGATLEVQPNKKICECEYCGTVQTIPSVNEEYLQNLFNRANNLRMKAEFDKAADTYERIIQEDATEAEAYWGLVLCKYGIEYVEDPDTHKRIPTCHRTSYEAVTADEDYRNAIKYADISQKSIYESEAKEIDDVQKGILAVAATEADYDVFICYKEADENGKRTVDSAIANDIYYELTQEGLKVFYSAITLEDKLGTEYEPYIFSALNSAKVMLVVGTKPEYFNAVWVKNEWSRFLKLMQGDRSRALIPCYRDMDAYDLPEEFAHLQAEDMSKIGFMNDIIRGIKKIIVKPEENTSQTGISNTPNVGSSNTENVNALLKRAFMFLEDQEWGKADEYCERILDIDPENASAYVGKLMAELKISKQTDLANKSMSFRVNDNYKKAIRFGDENLRTELENYNKIIDERNKKEQYNIALKKYQSASDYQDYIDAAKLFEKIIPWEDSEEKRQDAYKKAQEVKRLSEDEKKTSYEKAVNDYNDAKTEEEYRDIANRLKTSAGYINSDEIREECLKRADNLHMDKIKQKRAEISPLIDLIGLEHYFTGQLYVWGITSNGKVMIIGNANDFYLPEVRSWSNIVQIACSHRHIVGLKSDGRVVAAGYNKSGECNVNLWKDIISIDCSIGYTVGLKSDGTVIVAGTFMDGRQCYVQDWTDIKSVSCQDNFIIGLKSNGTLVSAGSLPISLARVRKWQNIIAVRTSDLNFIVGLKTDGTIVTEGKEVPLAVKWWKDVVTFSCDCRGVVGVELNGSVVSTISSAALDKTQLSRWNDIVAVSGGDNRFLGLKSDGTVVYTSVYADDRIDVSRWKLFGDDFSDKKQNIIILRNEKESLSKERAELKGLFSGKRRKEIDDRISEINIELNKWGSN